MGKLFGEPIKRNIKNVSWESSRMGIPLSWEIGRGVLWGLPSTLYLLISFPTIGFSAPIAANWKRACGFLVVVSCVYSWFILIPICTLMNSAGLGKHFELISYFDGGVRIIFLLPLAIVFISLQFAIYLSAISIILVGILRLKIASKSLSLQTPFHKTKFSEFFRLMIYVISIWPYLFIFWLVDPSLLFTALWLPQTAVDIAYGIRSASFKIILAIAESIWLVIGWEVLFGIIY